MPTNIQYIYQEKKLYIIKRDYKPSTSNLTRDPSLLSSKTPNVNSYQNKNKQSLSDQFYFFLKSQTYINNLKPWYKIYQRRGKELQAKRGNRSNKTRQQKVHQESKQKEDYRPSCQGQKQQHQRQKNHLNTRHTNTRNRKQQRSHKNTANAKADGGNTQKQGT
jgi:hypothetical protein